MAQRADRTRMREAAAAAVPRARRRWGAVLPIAPAFLVVLGLFIYPFVYGLELSVHPQGALAKAGIFANYAAFFGDARERLSIWNTLRLALPVTLLDLAVALPLAYRLRRPIPGQRVITGLLVIPMTLGTVLLAEGMIEFFGPAGWVNKLLIALHLIASPVQFVHNYTGVFLSLTISDFPAVFLVLLGYASGLDPALERAARTLGAGAWQRISRVTLPLLAPGIAAAAALSFVATFSVFPSAVLVGEPAGSTRVIALAAWQAAYENYDYARASAIAMVMAAIELVFVALVLAARSRAYRGATIGGRG
ncbi:MAG TPA: sugar ABC transporter permease [bacterium]|nr:sugar ABC transporter permease [bacterium]